MMHRRGFSPDELDALDPDLFQYLRIYDEEVEPNGARFETLMFANMADLILRTSGCLSERGQKEASILDWDFYGILRNKTRTELQKESVEKRKQEEERKRKDMIDSIMKTAIAKDKNNGKK